MHMSCVLCKVFVPVSSPIGLQARRIRWVAHVARMMERGGEGRGTVYRVLVGKRQGKEK